MIFLNKYRDIILFIWGISIITYIIIDHVVTQPEIFLLLGAAIGLPFFIDIRKPKGEDENRKHQPPDP